VNATDYSETCLKVAQRIFLGLYGSPRKYPDKLYSGDEVAGMAVNKKKLVELHETTANRIEE